MPGLDEKQLNSLIGNAATSRLTRKDDVNLLGNALNQYLVYGEQSVYKKELTDKELIELTISDLTGNINEAIKYAAEIHYSGTLPFETVYQVLSSSLPLVAGERQTTSPVVKKTMEYAENTVYFVPNNDAQQSQIYFYVPMGEYNKELKVQSMAYNQYVSGGFSGLIMNEIREKNSMAYTTSGGYGILRQRTSSATSTTMLGTKHNPTQSYC